MALRNQLPDTFYVDGNVLTLPIAGDETIPQWLERVRSVIAYLYPYGGEWTSELVIQAKKAGRLHLRRVVLGASYE